MGDGDPYNMEVICAATSNKAHQELIRTSSLDDVRRRDKQVGISNLPDGLKLSFTNCIRIEPRNQYIQSLYT